MKNSFEMKFAARIENNEPGLPCVSLSPDESANLYAGCGDAIAYAAADGSIEKLIYLHDLAADDAQAAAEAALAHGNAWLGMCSCHEFCSPGRLEANAPHLFARIARLVAENWDVG